MTPRSAAAILIMTAFVALGAGCNIIAPIAYAIHGPQKINPVHTLPKDRTTVIFVDDPSSKVAQRRLRYTMANTATNDLLEKRVLTDMLEPRGIIGAAVKEDHENRMSITELGRSVDAEVVIYALVTNYSLSPSSGTYLPTAELRVKVMDVASGERLWPDDEFGAPLSVQIPQRPGQSPTSAAERIEVEEQLAKRAGKGLAQLFYRHEITETVLNNR